MRVTIKTKLIAVFAVLIVMLAGSSFMAIKKASELQAQFDELADETAFQLEQSLKMEAAAARSMSLVKSYLAQTRRRRRRPVWSTSNSQRSRIRSARSAGS